MKPIIKTVFHVALYSKPLPLYLHHTITTETPLHPGLEFDRAIVMFVIPKMRLRDAVNDMLFAISPIETDLAN
jgi:hypothetical protein